MVPPYIAIPELPPLKPAVEAVSGQWAPDSLNVDVLSLSTQFIIPAQPASLNIRTMVHARILDTNPLRLHAEGWTLQAIQSSQSIGSTGVNDGYLTVRFTVPPPIGTEVTLTIDYTVPNVTENWRVGYHHLDEIAYTFNEPYGARLWLPVNDEPFDRYQWQIKASSANGWTIITNQGTPVLPDSFTGPSITLPSYLTHFAAAPFNTWHESVVTEPGTSVPLTYYARPAVESLARFDWRNTGAMLRTFSEYFGDYPFPREGYGMVEAPIMGGQGAMEHLAMSTMGSGLLTGDDRYENVVAHELAHQWFGNAVTLANFDEIWLNEGFAVFGEGIWLEFGRGDSALAAAHRREEALSYFQEAKQSMFPLTEPPADNLFSIAVYHKGGWVLQMLRKRLGNPLFFQRLRTYFSQHFVAPSIFVPATTTRFIDVMTANHTDVASERFLTEWLYTAGHPKLRLQTIQKGSSAEVIIRQIQTGSVFQEIPLRVVNREPGAVSDQYVTMSARELHIQLNSLGNADIVIPWQDEYLYELEVEPDERIRLVPKSIHVSTYPNPANSNVVLRIQFTLPGIADARVKLFDVVGRELYSEPMNRVTSGNRVLQPRLPVLTPGVYFWSVDAAGKQDVTPMTILP
ncbi:MAG: M1 family aminopeptidase [bacterium]|nr:M1 family aminopeptidase [bacterium]